MNVKRLAATALISTLLISYAGAETRTYGSIDLTGLAKARITRPACFIAGSRDAVLRFVPGVDLVENMKRWIDDLRTCEIIDGAGHWIQQERAQEVNALLLGFLDTLDRRTLNARNCQRIGRGKPTHRTVEVDGFKEFLATMTLKFDA